MKDLLRLEQKKKPWFDCPDWTVFYVRVRCLQNVTANHRVNDVIATEDGPQTLVGRFMYGPLDMVTLTGEKVKNSDVTNDHRVSGTHINLCVVTLLGGHPADDTTSVWALGALWHGGDQQQWKGRIHNPQKQEAGSWSLPD